MDTISLAALVVSAAAVVVGLAVHGRSEGTGSAVCRPSAATRPLRQRWPSAFSQLAGAVEESAGRP